MIVRIARKEFTEMIRDGRLRWAAAIVFALLSVALLTGWKHYADSSKQRALARQDERARWLEQGPKNPHSAAHYGVYAFKPELPLSAVDRGLNSYLGIAVWLEAHKQNLFKFRPAEDATAAARFGELTAAVTLQILIPLLIILLLHAAFTGEREQGTLRLLASLGIPARRLALGKALGASAVLGALLVPASLIGAAAMMFYAGAGAAGSGGGRTVAMAASYLLYYGVFAAASLLVSARVRTSQMALIVLLAAWFLNCFVAPRVPTDLAGRLRPAPSAMQLAAGVERDLELGLDGHGAYELENPLKLLAGRFDLAFVVIWLYPLLILALGFNLLAGERENGTLALLLAQPVSLRTVVLGKTLVRAAIVFAPVIVFAAIGLSLAGVKLGDPGALSRFALWAAAALLYGAFWFALAALVNARGKSSAANALILAGAWLLFVVLLPSAINVIAATLYPVPSRVEYIQAMREASEGEVAARSQIMAAFYEDHPELAKGAVTRRDEFTLTKERINQRMEERLRPVAARFEQQLARQQRITGWFRFLTPALLAQEALRRGRNGAGAVSAVHRAGGGVSPRVAGLFQSAHRAPRVGFVRRFRADSALSVSRRRIQTRHWRDQSAVSGPGGNGGANRDVGALPRRHKFTSILITGNRGFSSYHYTPSLNPQSLN